MLKRIHVHWKRHQNNNDPIKMILFGNTFAGIPPVIYMLFNSSIRKAMLRLGGTQSRVTVLSLSHPTTQRPAPPRSPIVSIKITQCWLRNRQETPMFNSTAFCPFGILLGCAHLPFFPLRKILPEMPDKSCPIVAGSRNCTSTNDKWS